MGKANRQGIKDEAGLGKWIFPRNSMLIRLNNALTKPIHWDVFIDFCKDILNTSNKQKKIKKQATNQSINQLIN